MKLIVTLAATSVLGLTLLYFTRPDLLAKLQSALGTTATTTSTTTGPAPISNVPTPTTIGQLNISGSAFGTSTTGNANSVT